MINFNELNFGSSDLTWLLAAPAAVFLLSIYAITRRRIETRLLISAENERLLLDGGEKESRSWKVLTMTLAVALIGFATLRPQYGFQWLEGAVSGSDTVFALDVSQSMLAPDIAPNRLARAKRDIARAVDQLQGGRVALISFAGVSFTESPLTRDYNAFKQLLATTDSSSVPIPGSNIELAIERAIKLLDGSKSPETANLRRRTVVIVSDGEELQGSAEKGAAMLKQKGVELIIFGVGTDSGGMVPPRNRDPLDFTARRESVTSKLNRPELQRIASTTGAQLLFLDQNTVSNSAATLTNLLLGQSSGKAGTNRAKVYTEYYQLPLLLGLLLLMYLWRPAMLVLTLVLLSPICSYASDPESLGAKGSQLLQRGELDEAEKVFTEAIPGAAANDPRPLLGLGTARYRQGRFVEAAESFAEAEKRADQPALKALANFNLGNALLQADKTDEAIAAYEQGLTLSPHDAEMRKNLEIAKKIRRKKNPEDEKKNDKQSSDQKDQSKQQQQSEDNQQSEQSDSEKQNSGESGKDQNQQNDQQSSDDSKGAQGQKDSEQGLDQNKEEKKEDGSESAQSGSEQDNDKQGGTNENDTTQTRSDSNTEDQQDRLADSKPGDEESEDQAGQEQQAVGVGEEGSESIDPRSQLIQSVTESRNALSKFREQEGEKILKSRGMPYPTKDW